MKKKIIITLIIILAPVVFFILPMMMPKPGGYPITTEKDPAFAQKIERIFIVASVEEHLIDVFAHSFEHSMVSALQENGVEAVFKFADHEQEAEPSSVDATMRIDIKPLYLAQEDGYQAIVGTEYEVTVIHTATGKQVWHATGKVDYLRSKYTKKPGYSPGGGIRKEFAWHATAAIAWTFISEVNGQKPTSMYTATGGREYHGQRID
jgi:phosphopantetheine adenylyltransferase